MKKLLWVIRDRPEIPHVLSVFPKEKQLQTTPPPPSLFASSKTSGFARTPSPICFPWVKPQVKKCEKSHTFHKIKIYWTNLLHKSTFHLKIICLYNVYASPCFSKEKTFVRAKTIQIQFMGQKPKLMRNQNHVVMALNFSFLYPKFCYFVERKLLLDFYLSGRIVY